MILIKSVKELLDQLTGIVCKLSDEEFSQPVAILSNASVCQYTNQIIAVYTQLFKGYESGNVRYDHRRMTQDISMRHETLEIIEKIGVEVNKLDKPLLFETNYLDLDGSPVLIKTSYNRELVNNMEYTKLQIEWIRVAIRQISGVNIPGDFRLTILNLKNWRATA